MGKNMHIGGQVVIGRGVDATGTTDGTLVVSGGAGVGQALRGRRHLRARRDLRPRPSAPRRSLLLAAHPSRSNSRRQRDRR